VTRAIRSTTAYVADQCRGGELQGVHLADCVPLEELKVALLGSLPFGDGLKGLDVPTNERREGNGRVLLSPRQTVVFKLDFTVPGPGQGRSTMCKGLGFPMNDSVVHALAHDRGITDRAICLPACLDRCHDGVGGDKPILSPLCLLRKR